MGNRAAPAIAVVLVSAVTVAALSVVMHMTHPNPRQLPGSAASPRTQPSGKYWIAEPGRPGPLQQGVDPNAASRQLEVSVYADHPEFKQHELKANPGEVVSLTFSNDSDPKLHYHHTWVLVKPGSEKKVLAAADQAGPSHGWIPESPDVLAFTKVMKPGESTTIYFRAPSEAGDYPYLCTFPGHGLNMKGVLHVK
jgi:azurin